MDNTTHMMQAISTGAAKASGRMKSSLSKKRKMLKEKMKGMMGKGGCGPKGKKMY